MQKLPFIDAIWQYFSPPIFEGDEEKTRVARVLNAILLAYFCFLAVAGLAALFFYTYKTPSLIIVAVGFSVLFLTRRMMLNGAVYSACHLVTLFQWLGFTFLIAFSDGINSIVPVYYLCGTVISGLMLGARAAGGYALASFAAGLGLTLLEAGGVALPKIFTRPENSSLVDLSLTLILTTLTVNISLVSLKEALRRARSELQERRLVENELRQSENRYRALFETAANPILLIDAASLKIIDSNAAATDQYGYSRQELLGLSLLNLVALPQPVERVALPPTSDKPLQYAYHRKKDGGFFPIEMTTTTISLAGREILVHFIHDIGARRQRETEMEAIVAIGAAMRHAPTRAELLPIILQQVMDMLAAAGTALVIRDAYTHETVVELGYGRFAAATGRRAPAGLSLQSLAGLSGPFEDAICGPAHELLEHLAISQPVSYLDCSLLINQNETLGALLVGHERGMTAEQQRLLTTISEIAASALKRITLFEAATAYAHQMATAGELGLLLAQTLDLPTLYRRAGQYMLTMLPGTSALIVSSFDPASELFTGVYGYADGAEIDITDLPPMPLEPPGRGMQSQVVHSHQPLIIADLLESRKHLQKSVLVGDLEKMTRSALLVPMLAHGRVLGVVNVQSYSLNRFNQKDAEVLTLVGNTIAVAIENSRLFNGLQQSNIELTAAYDATIAGWSRALDLRDMDTEGHSQRVADLTVRLGQALNLSEKVIAQLRRGAQLHDLGKIGVPDEILHKPGPLTAEEWVVMRRHPADAYEMLSPIEFLHDALDIPYQHHEKWDGSGYPRGLQGEQIALAARIFAVVDVWDALNSDRPYGKHWPQEKIKEHIRAQAGHHFDPAVVEVFMQVLEADGKR